MKFTIDQVEINGDAIKAILKLEGQINKWDIFSERDICSKAEREIVDTLVEKYLAENLGQIMSEIDKQQIINMIVLNSARRVSP